MAFEDYSMIERQTLCTTCDGRKYVYRTGTIRNRRTGEEIYSNHLKGDICPTCHGSGMQPFISIGKTVSMALVLLIVIYLIVLL
jgi:tRNA U54 and U55 pseudouridine synthase Pus10